MNRLVWISIQFACLFCLQHPVWAQVSDSIPGPAPVADTLRISDSLLATSDMEAPVKYKASDSIVLDIPGKMLYLYGTAEVKYLEYTLNAACIRVDWGNSTMTAEGMPGPSGDTIGLPVFDEAGQKYFAEKIIYNFKTNKGIIRNARTNQDGQVVSGSDIKKDNDSTYYIRNGYFTTCDAEHPHYFFRSNKLKIIPKKQIISGPLFMVVEDFPIPVVIPFGFFPQQTRRKSGLILPEYGEARDRGFFLRRLGYYWAVNDYMDLQFDGDIFANGSYRLGASTKYKLRYRFDGGLGFEYGSQRYFERTDPDFSITNTFMVHWRHRQTIAPRSSFNATVDAGSSKFYRLNSYNTNDFLSNNLRSSVAYNQGFGRWNLTATISHFQDLQKQTVAMSLPNINLAYPRFFPFQRKQVIGRKRWYENIGMSYSMLMDNSFSVPDSLFDDVFLRPRQPVSTTLITSGDTLTQTRTGWDYYSNGIQHTIPVSTSIKMLKYLTLNPSFTYKELWYIKTIEKQWNDSVLVRDTLDGFEAARFFSTSATFQTTNIYGIFNLNGKRKAAIRHVASPFLSYTYTPDFSTEKWGYYKTVQSDTLGNTVKYSRFEGLKFGGPGAGESQLIGFGVNNQLQLKMLKRSFLRDSLGKAPVQGDFDRLNLIDNFSLSGAYNLALDSMNWSPFQFNGRTQLLSGVLNLNVSGQVDPYKVDSTTRQRYNEKYWDDGFTPGRLSSLQVTLQSTLRSKKRTGDKHTENVSKEEQQQIDLYRDQYLDFSIPWNLALNINCNYINTGYSKDTLLTVGLNGDLNLTPKWKIAFTTGYDVTQEKFTFTNISVHRDLHCWEMSFNWIPFGTRQSYTFSLNVKSATLRDLRLTKRRDWQDRFRTTF